MKKNMIERVKMVKAMEYICRQLNNETHFFSWLSVGVADEDIPYADLTVTEPIEDDPAYYYAEEDETFADLMATFLRVMMRAYKNGGLYCDSIVSTECPEAEKPFGIVKWTNADLGGALEENGVAPTEYNIATLRDECENNHHFTDGMIEAGWNTINYYITCMDEQGYFKDPEEEE